MKMFQVIETGKGIRKTYMMMMTEEQMSKKLKGLNEMNGYIEGVGGDRTYSAVAWTVGNDGSEYVDLETIWKLYGTKIA